MSTDPTEMVTDRPVPIMTVSDDNHNEISENQNTLEEKGPPTIVINNDTTNGIVKIQDRKEQELVEAIFSDDSDDEDRLEVCLNDSLQDLSGNNLLFF